MPKLEVSLSIIATVVAVISLALSFRTSREQNRQQRAMLRLESARERDRLADKTRANVTARLFFTDHSARLSISNAGPAPAQITNISVDDTPIAQHPLIRTEGPVTLLAPDASVDLTMITFDGMPSLYKVDIAWEDDSGIPGMWSSQLSLPR